MAIAESVGIELMEEMIDRVGKSYNEMTSHLTSSPHTKSLFEDIKQHFLNMQKSLEQKFVELETKERAFMEKKSEYHTILEEREAAVTSKEQILWDRLQELRDEAVTTIIEAHKNSNVASPVVENKVCTSANDTLNTPFPALEEGFPSNKSSHSTEVVTGKVEPQTQLKQLCEEMNVKGLLKFFSDNRKNLAPIREELPLALRSANEPAHFVLKALEGFYPQNLSKLNHNSKEFSNLQALRRTCLLLMESAAPLLAMGEPGDDHLLSSEIKQQAKAIADEWKLKLAELDLDTSNEPSLEAQAFLQLLATFSISSEFDEDELCKLVIAMSRRRRQAPELCLAVGLTHKSKEVVGALIAKGRLIDAVHFSYFFQLTETFPLVPLLKQYMENTEETFTRSIAAGLEKEAANQELSVLKTVIRCIEEYSLQEEYPPLPLQERIDHLERTRAGMKRSMDAAKFPAKKHHSYEGHAFHSTHNRFSKHTFRSTPNRFTAPTVYSQRTRYYTGRDGYPYISAPPYNAPGHATYSHQANYPDDRVPPYVAPANYRAYIGPSVQLTIPGTQPTSSNYGSYPSNNAPSSQHPYM